MPLLVNLRHLEQHSQMLKGELPVEELDIADVDELVHARQPLQHDLEVQLMDKSLLVRGRIRIILDCECSRCLKPYQVELDIDDYACLLPLEGEERAAIVNDSVDLTPYLREDILLRLPQHPLCRPECDELPAASFIEEAPPSGASLTEFASAWAELEKLKLKKK